MLWVCYSLEVYWSVVNRYWTVYLTTNIFNFDIVVISWRLLFYLSCLVHWKADIIGCFKLIFWKQFVSANIDNQCSLVTEFSTSILWTSFFLVSWSVVFVKIFNFILNYCFWSLLFIVIKMLIVASSFKIFIIIIDNYIILHFH